MHKPIKWDAQKNDLLKRMRGVSFEDVLAALENGKLLADQQHPNIAQYPRQRMYIVNILQYACVVPYVEEHDHIFLKTLYFSRKYTREFLSDNHESYE